MAAECSQINIDTTADHERDMASPQFSMFHRSQSPSLHPHVTMFGDSQNALISAEPETWSFKDILNNAVPEDGQQSGSEAASVQHQDNPMQDLPPPSDLDCFDKGPAGLQRDDQSNRIAYTDDDEHSDSDSMSEEHVRRQYELRPRPEGDEYVQFATWMDQDRSGNFDPNEKPKQPVPRCSKRTHTRRESRLANGDPAPAKWMKTSTTLKRRQEGARFCVRLKINTAKATPLMKHVPNNWPEEYHNIFTDQAQVKAVEGKPYALRSSTRDGLEDEDDDDLTGHPEGRGCKACRDTSHACSLLEPAGQYPCETCAEAREDCELLVPPKFKQACGMCKRKKLPCSYAHDREGDHSIPCEYCEEKGFSCIAGPRDNPAWLRMDANGKPAIDRMKDPKYAGRQRRQKPPRVPTICIACEREQRSCSYAKLKANMPPTRPCDHCLFMQLPCRLPGQPDTIEHPPAHPNTSPPTPPGITKTITTALSHPITFNSIDPRRPCHFCNTNPLLPIYGLPGGPRPITVRAWPDGKGYTPLADTHSIPPTRVCSDCSLARLRIIFCRGHRFRSLDLDADAAADAKRRGTRPRALLRALMDTARSGLEGDAKVAAVRREQRRWCAVCAMPAQFECCCADAVGGDGCGLRLCFPCRLLLVGTEGPCFGGDFQAFVAGVGGCVEMEPVRRYYKGPLRADLEILRADGLLMAQVGAQLPESGDFL